MKTEIKLKRFLKNCREWVWPTMGWKRFLRYQLIKLSRMTGGKKSIARGFACGAAASFTPFIGLHFVIASIFAKTARGNIIAALIGTGIGNPWTFPFIWSASYNLGNEILHNHDHESDSLTDDLSFSTLLTNPLEIFLPTLVGSLPLIAIVWPASYLLIIHVINLRSRRKNAYKAKAT